MKQHYVHTYIKGKRVEMSLGSCDWCNHPLEHRVPTVRSKSGLSFHLDCYDAHRAKELKQFLEVE